MATKDCTKCEKGAGVTTCDGCQKCFCIKHIIEHRQELAAELDRIGQEYDILYPNLTEENTVHTLSLEIDRWEQQSIRKIQVAAEVARVNLQQLLDQSRNKMKTSAQELFQELQTRRKLDDYTEIELTNWSKKLNDMRKSLETATTLEIVADNNVFDAIHLIKVTERNASKSTQELFDKATDELSVSADRMMAILNSNLSFHYHSILGKSLYYSGVHDIHFRVERKGFDNFFFGIVTSSQDIIDTIFDTLSANGWWGFDISVLNGKQRDAYCRKSLEIGDVVKLILDCDKKTNSTNRW